LYDIKEGLTRLDPARGLLTVAVVTPSPSGKKQWTKHKGSVQEGLVSFVTDAADDIVMHSLAWIGAIDLSDQQVVTILDPKVANLNGRIEGKSNCVLLTTV